MNMHSQWRNRKIIFSVMFAMIGMRLVIFGLGIAGLFIWAPPIGASILSWIIPVGMPTVMIMVMLIVGRKQPMHESMIKGSNEMPLLEIMKKRFVLGEITKQQYEDVKRILSQTESRGQKSE